MAALSSSRVRRALLLFAVALLLWLIGLILYARDVPTTVKDTTTKVDAIVALTGGSGRIAAGIDLLAAGMAEQLFISGTGPMVSAADLIREDRPDRETLLKRMSIGAEAEDTTGNAIETAAWARANGVTSIRLVTAAYHMPRSLLELEQAMPNIRIIPHPVFPDQVKMDWWRYPGSAGLLSREYTKYLLANLRLWFAAITTTQSDGSMEAKPE